MHDNLRRKRIYLERENFDIMSILRQSMSSNPEPKSARVEVKSRRRLEASPKTGSGENTNREQQPLNSNSLS